MMACVPVRILASWAESFGGLPGTHAYPVSLQRRSACGLGPIRTRSSPQATGPLLNSDQIKFVLNLASA